MFYVLGMFAVQFIEEVTDAWVQPTGPKRNWWWFKPLLIVVLGLGWVLLVTHQRWWYGFGVCGGAVIVERISDLLIATTARNNKR